MKYDKTKFKKGEKGLTEKFLYVEGNTNAKFYKNLYCLKDFTIKNGGSRSTIEKLVNDQSRNFGLIDGDYRLNKNQSILQINFYSIENICLLYQDEFKNLKKIIEERDLGIETGEIKFFKGTFNVKDGRKAIFTLVETSDINSIEKHKVHLIKSKVKCSYTYQKHISVKDVIDGYNKFLRVSKSLKFKYIEELYRIFSKENEIDILFDSQNKEKLLNINYNSNK